VTLLGLLALAAALAAAVVRDRRVPEAAVAAAGAAVLLLAGAISWSDAWHEARQLAPTLGFLAALLVLGEGCERAGLFSSLAAVMARAGRGSGGRLLLVVVGVAALVTAVLGLDATVVLLTPAALAAAQRSRLPARPSVYACTHLANAGSLLLPVSNLTNLLAFHASGLSFTRFASLMALPWVAAVALEWGALRWFFREELPERGDVAARRGGASGRGAASGRGGAAIALPRGPLAVLAATLAGFALSSPLGYDPLWPAALGAAAMIAPHLARGAARPADVVRAADLPLLVFVLSLGIIVRAVDAHGLGKAVDGLLPAGDGLLALLGATAIAAVLANLVNNVPALLVLLPAAAAAGPGTLLAVLIGVNAGPNLTYTGSLATLLWRRVLHARGHAPDLGEFLRLGALAVPPVLVGATVALWLAL
jgi:arsenical pump membrane protein